MHGPKITLEKCLREKFASQWYSLRDLEDQLGHKLVPYYDAIYQSAKHACKNIDPKPWKGNE